MKYEIIRTDTADAGIRKIILYVAQNFGNTVALEKLDQIEKDLVFYKIDEGNKKVVVYAIVDQRQDYLNIIRGL